MNVPEMDRLDSNGTIPQTFKEALLLHRSSIRALETACILLLETERGIVVVVAECKPGINACVARSHARGRHAGQ